jgi:hypothetical protein
MDVHLPFGKKGRSLNKQSVVTMLKNVKVAHSEVNAINRKGIE